MNKLELHKEADKKDNEALQIIQTLSPGDDPQKREQKIIAIADRRKAAELYRTRADTAEDGEREANHLAIFVYILLVFGTSCIYSIYLRWHTLLTT